MNEKQQKAVCAFEWVQRTEIATIKLEIDNCMQRIRELLDVHNLPKLTP